MERVQWPWVGLSSSSVYWETKHVPQSGPIREVGVTVHLGTGIGEHKHQLLGTKMHFHSAFCQHVMRIPRKRRKEKTNDFQCKQPVSYRSCFLRSAGHWFNCSHDYIRVQRRRLCNSVAYWLMPDDNKICVWLHSSIKVWLTSVSILSPCAACNTSANELLNICYDNGSGYNAANNLLLNSPRASQTLNTTREERGNM